jgi:hypothetical protein
VELGKNMSRENREKLKKIEKNTDRFAFVEIFDFIVFVYGICLIGAYMSVQNRFFVVYKPVLRAVSLQDPLEIL